MPLSSRPLYKLSALKDFGGMNMRKLVLLGKTVQERSARPFCKSSLPSRTVFNVSSRKALSSRAASTASSARILTEKGSLALQ